MLLYHVISLTGVFALMQHRQKVLILQMRMLSIPGNFSALLEIGLQDLEQSHITSDYHLICDKINV